MFSEPVEFRVYKGSEDQNPDPLIQAALGQDASAYRGLAYVVLEDLALHNFGNRVPELSFEVFSESEEVLLQNVCRKLLQTGGQRMQVEGSFLQSLDGIVVANRGTVLEELSQLQSVFGYELSSQNNTVRIDEERPNVFRTIHHRTRDSPNAAQSAGQHWSKGRLHVPSHAITFTYIEADRDYQRASQHCGPRSNLTSHSVLETEAVISASLAKTIADARYVSSTLGHERTILLLPYEFLDVRVGDGIVMSPEISEWIVEHRTFEQFSIKLSLVRALTPRMPAQATSPKALPNNIDREGAYRVVPCDIPLLPWETGIEGRLITGVLAEQGSFRQATVLMSINESEEYLAAFDASTSSLVGKVLNALAAGPSACWDNTCYLDVEIPADSNLESRSHVAVLNGANMALVGQEIVQFARAVNLGQNTFRLTELLRGLRGTENEVQSHVAGETFMLLSPDSLMVKDSQLVPGCKASVRIVGEATPLSNTAQVDLIYRANNLRPLAPVHVKARRAPDGLISITWIRRSARGYSWIDGTDVPPSVDSSGYRITISHQGRQVTIHAPNESVVLSLVHELALGGPMSTFDIELAELSSTVGLGITCRRSVVIG